MSQSAATVGTVPSPTFERFAAGCAVLSGLCLLVSGVAFLLGSGVTSAGVLVLSAVLTMAALLGFYARLRAVDEGFAMLGLVLGLVGAVGALLHGGFDFALSLTPVTAEPTILPSPTDPRGLLAGAVAGLGTLTFGWLIIRGGPFPRALGYLACLSGALLVLLYLIRLFVLDAGDLAVRGPALLSGLLVPVVTISLGLALYRAAATQSATR